ncbi:putative homeobox protein knotted-1-like 4 isoform X2 [Sesbania bispinosa]|nr:putative homeobox protein knotted-1-like 4 isoform X2 [Sesbania bispinosa]
MQQQRLPPPTWLNNATNHQRHQQNFLHLQADTTTEKSNCESDELWEYKVDQLPRIDTQLQRSQRVVEKYSHSSSSLGNNNNRVVDEKELDQFMVCPSFYS